MTDAWLWMTDAAQVLGISRQRVHQLTQAGRLEARQIAVPANGRGYLWQVSRASVERRLAAHPLGERPAPKPAPKKRLSARKSTT